MNLSNYSNCCSVPEYFNISFTEFYKQQSNNQQNNFKLDQHLPQQLVQQIKISPKLIEYILKICQQNQFHYLTKNNALLMIQKYVKSKNIQLEDDIQLVSLVCLDISQRIFENRKNQCHNMIHTFSNHNYRNKEILKLEQKISQELEFNLEFRSIMISDRINDQLEMSRNIIPQNYYQVIKETSLDILDVLYEDPDTIDLNNYQICLDLFAASIIQTAFIILTQQNGRFPITWRLGLLIQKQEEQICSYSKKIMKFILDKQVYKELEL